MTWRIKSLEVYVVPWSNQPEIARDGRIERMIPIQVYRNLRAEKSRLYNQARLKDW